VDDKNETPIVDDDHLTPAKSSGCNRTKPTDDRPGGYTMHPIKLEGTSALTADSTSRLMSAGFLYAFFMACTPSRLSQGWP
jgi:hypothetical protein